ncbi:hypothetical protein [Bosea sp. (in: a-proteobacteria)]|jgi:hypothetical protein|uniref:hypothetical protein n=1 Tax=Bosea sp. (in: a-proteobacteria) TaxID=1871050 RepID=UPI00356A05D4
MAPRKARAPAPAPTAQPVAPDQHAGAGAAAVSSPAAELPADLGRYPVLSPLRFDGRIYRPDDPDADEVTMPRVQAEALQPLLVLGEELA